MRENFEKLEKIKKYINYVFWNENTKGYCNNSDNPIPLDFASFINGSWYTYQEQQKIIDQLKQEKLDQANKLDKIFYGDVK